MGDWKRRVDQAFEHYLRWGRVPETRVLTTARDLSRKALGDVRPTSYYIWRTAQDERVRSSHAANDGKVFAWGDPPTTGHPGHERNCRCWADPYYGTPFVSDTTLPLKRQSRVSASLEEPWASIETLSRPDGSLAQSRIVMRDGTRIRSTFNGGLVVNDVTLPDGRQVRIVRQDGVQSIYVAGSGTPVVMSDWTPNGPRIAAPRTRVAFSGSPFDLLPGLTKPEDDTFAGRNRFGDIEVLDPNRPGGMDPGAAGAAIGMALLALYLASQADKPSVGAGSEDKPALTIRIWGPDGKLTPIPVSVTSLAAEQVAQNCRRLPEVQQWTDAAALALAPQRATMSAGTWGTLVHSEIEAMLKTLRDRFPLTYIDTWAERTFAPDATDATRSSWLTSRLDIVEIRDQAICIYDIKTGQNDISSQQLRKYLALAAAFGKLTFYVIQVKPTISVQGAKQ